MFIVVCISSGRDLVSWLGEFKPTYTPWWARILSHCATVHRPRRISKRRALTYVGVSDPIRDPWLWTRMVHPLLPMENRPFPPTSTPYTFLPCSLFASSRSVSSGYSYASSLCNTYYLIFFSRLCTDRTSYNKPSFVFIWKLFMLIKNSYRDM